jgi:cobalt-zinc-cadmium efflux system membrane fusion protein
MNPSNTILSLLALLTLTTLLGLSACGKKTSTESIPTAAVESPEAKEAKSAEPEIVTLKPGADKLAGIEVATLNAQSLPRLLKAPGEVKTNDYRSAQVTTRVPAQVVRRLAKLGDAVKLGQSLVVLTSIEVAEAQGDAQIKARDWSRVQELGEAVVGGRRYSEARIATEQARAKLVAYGMTPNEAANRQGRELGQFTLQAPRAGTVLRDAFVEGERIEPGRVLFTIADESATWVEANLSPADAKMVVEGGLARVKVDGTWLNGKVIQKHHLIDEVTRTIPVRIEVKSSGDHLHTGEFVDTRIEIGKIDHALAVPSDALYQGTDNEWAVFVQEAPDRFRRVKVTLKDDLGDSNVVEGVVPGAKVVIKGAFFLNSELAKASFGEE